MPHGPIQEMIFQAVVEAPWFYNSQPRMRCWVCDQPVALSLWQWTQLEDEIGRKLVLSGDYVLIEPGTIRLDVPVGQFDCDDNLADDPWCGIELPWLDLREMAFEHLTTV